MKQIIYHYVRPIYAVVRWHFDMKTLKYRIIYIILFAEQWANPGMGWLIFEPTNENGGEKLCHCVKNEYYQRLYWPSAVKGMIEWGYGKTTKT